MAIVEFGIRDRLCGPRHISDSVATADHVFDTPKPFHILNLHGPHKLVKDRILKYTLCNWQESRQSRTDSDAQSQSHLVECNQSILK
jgi:hypothetical protein